MIIDVKPTVTYYSKINNPDFRGLAEELIDYAHEAKPNGDNLIFIVNASFHLKNLDNNQTHEILKAQTTYDIVTDGSITAAELYRFYHYTQSAMISHLHKQGNPPSARVHPVPFEVVQEPLQRIADNFGKKR